MGDEIRTHAMVLRVETGGTCEAQKNESSDSKTDGGRGHGGLRISGFESSRFLDDGFREKSNSHGWKLSLLPLCPARSVLNALDADRW